MYREREGGKNREREREEKRQERESARAIERYVHIHRKSSAEKLRRGR